MNLFNEFPEKVCKCGCGENLEHRRPNVQFATKKCRDDYYNSIRAQLKENAKQCQRDEEEKAWREFDERNPNVYDYIKSDLLKLIGTTEGALSVGAVIEYQVRMIWGQKIPNAYKKFYREKFIREYPEYAHLFER